MNKKNKTQEELNNEIKLLRKRITELEKLDSEHKQQQQQQQQQQQKDLIGRKKIAAALRESEARFRMLFNAGKDFMAVHQIEKDGRVTNFMQVNDAFCEGLGYTREEMLKLSPRDIDEPERLEQLPAIIEKLLKEKHVLFETEHVAKYGHRIPVEVSAVLFQTEDGPCALSVARDITERKKAETELKALTQRLEMILGATKTGIDIIDSDFNMVYITAVPTFDFDFFATR